jgi:hypothetical protein
MIEIVKSLPNPEKIQKWLEDSIRPHLTQDVSNYAKGRLRCWLGIEPALFSPFNIKPAVNVSLPILTRIREILGWDFQFALVTYSGDEEAIGISPHRDAGYADYEAYSINVSGEAKFDYWCDRQSFDGSHRGKLIRTSGITDPTHSLILKPGEVTRFNCKNLHSCTPSAKRWNINFWKAKPKTL